MDKCGNCWKNLDKALISVRKSQGHLFFFFFSWNVQQQSEGCTASHFAVQEKLKSGA